MMDPSRLTVRIMKKDKKMQEDKIYKRKSAGEMYSAYVSSQGGDNKGRFENLLDFRKGFSKYDMETLTIEAGTDCKWDKKNCGGVPVDYDEKNHLLYVDGSEAHTLLVGATGSKKSRLVVMPMVRILASSGEGMIICDPKGEIYRRTAQFLYECGYEVNAINLREPGKGDGWNMLAIPYRQYCNGNVDKACEFINDATINLMPVYSKDPYWDYTARDMLFGLVLLLFDICKELNLSDDNANMGNVLQLRQELFTSSDSDTIKASPIWQYAVKNQLVRTRLLGIVNCPERTLACIVSSFDQHMSCFSLQPKVVEMLSETTFDFKKMGFEKKAIFLIVPDEKTTYHKIVTIVVKQLYEFLIDNVYKVTEDNRFPVRVNFILDEFSSLPTITDFPQMVTASRSRNIRFTLIVQSKHQLRQRYKEETDTIISNCSNWLFLTSREIELLREISELSGKKGSNNEELISVSRLQHLDKEKGECLIMSGRKHPYFSHLPDISEYDHDMVAIMPMKERTVKNNFLSLKEGYFSELLRTKIKADIGQNEEKEDILDLQSELVKKFDELFGTDPDADA